jgi:phosphate transport system permease protein
MTVTAPGGSVRTGALAPKRPAMADRTFQVLTLACGLGVLAILALITVSMTGKALPALRHEGLRFVTSSHWDPANDHYGAFAYIYGTLVTAVIALVAAVPVSVGIALFLSEVAPGRLRKPVIYLIDLLAAVPSVVFGLWGLLVLSGPLGRRYGQVGRLLHGVPVLGTLFAGGNSGRSLFTAGLVVALMITPIITSLTREVFETVPAAQKEAALALGATRWEMIRGSVLPYGRGGVVGAVMLGLGRAMGETIAVTLLIGSSAQVTAHLFAPGDSMAAVIANQFGEATGLNRSALIALGVVLFAVTIVVNAGARAVLSRSERRLEGAP